jgi:hypothetical protein
MIRIMALDPARAVFALLIAAILGSLPGAGLGALVARRRGAAVGAIVGAALGILAILAWLVVGYLIIRATAPIG